MRSLITFIGLLVFGLGKAQNVGIGTSSPVTRLDIVSGNNWDLVNGSGDLHLGANGVHLRIGMAIEGGGIGATGIMQSGLNGGYNVLSLGAQGQYLVHLNGSTGRVGIGTDNPSGKLEIVSGTGDPQLNLVQGSLTDYARIRFNNGNTVTNSRSFEIGGLISNTQASIDKLNFYHTGAGNILTLTGDGYAGFSTLAPGAKVDIHSTGGTPQLQLVQLNGTDFARLRLKNSNYNTTARYFDIAGYISPTTSDLDRLNFYTNGGGGNILSLAGNGAVYVNGSAGLPGQVLKSAGTNGPAVWVDPVRFYKAGNSVINFAENEAESIKAFPAAGDITFTCNQPSNVAISTDIQAQNWSGCPLGICNTVVELKLFVDGVEWTISNWPSLYDVNGQWPPAYHLTIANAVILVAAGTHTIQFRLSRTGTTAFSAIMLYHTVMVTPY